MGCSHSHPAAGGRRGWSAATGIDLRRAERRGGQSGRGLALSASASPGAASVPDTRYGMTRNRGPIAVLWSPFRCGRATHGRPLERRAPHFRSRAERSRAPVRTAGAPGIARCPAPRSSGRVADLDRPGPGRRRLDARRLTVHRRPRARSSSADRPSSAGAADPGPKEPAVYTITTTPAAASIP
jgi:hypothetical protein